MRRDATYPQIVAAGCVLLRRDGIQALSLRRVARASRVSMGAIQFHFRTQDELAATIVGAWADGVSHSLEKVAGDARGLRRTWKLCEAWTAMSHDVRIVCEPLLVDEDRSPHPCARAAVVENLRRWIKETRRSLRQARLQHELVNDVDVARIAIEIHQLLWSQCWSAPVLGREAAKQEILRGVWHRLSTIAIDPTASLPPPPETQVTRDREDADESPVEISNTGEGIPTWRMVLEPHEPLYQAFLRSEIMGDPRNFTRPPDVTDDDIAEAQKFAKNNGRVPLPPDPEPVDPV